MTFSHLALIFLALFPGAVHAQAATQHCHTPRLKKGYIVPEQERYDHNFTITYACDSGHKPAVEGWWATSKCQNGFWSPLPECIEEGACFPLQIPNAEFKASSDGYFNAGHVLRMVCEEGYKHKGFDATAKCENGSWSSVPVCERDDRACQQPPQIPHAVITNQVYKELFNPDSEVKYQCEDGYTLVPTNNINSIFCLSGNWTKGPRCRARSGSGRGRPTGGTAGTRPGTGYGGTTAGGTGTRPGTGLGGTSVEGTGTRPGTGDGGTTAGGAGTRPGTGQGGTSGGTAGTRPGTGLGGTSVEGTGTRPGTGYGGTTAGGTGTRPGTGYGGTTVASAVTRCGGYPHVPNGVLVLETDTFLKYQCVSHYVLATSFDMVTCQSNGRWTQLPVCQAAFCRLDPGYYVDGKVSLREVQFLSYGERKAIQCNYHNPYYGYYYTTIAQCNNGRVTWEKCCHPNDRRPQLCI